MKGASIEKSSELTSPIRDISIADMGSGSGFLSCCVYIVRVRYEAFRAGAAIKDGSASLTVDLYDIGC